MSSRCRSGRPSRRRGAQRGRRPDLRRARSARRHPTGRRLPHPAHGHDRRRGRGPVPRRPARAGRAARPGHGRRRRPAQGDGGAAARAAVARVAHCVAALPPRRGRLVPAQRAGAAARDAVDRGLGGPRRDDRLRTRPRPRRAHDRAAWARAEGRRLVRGGDRRRSDPHVSCVAGASMRRCSTSRSTGPTTSTWRRTGPSRAPRSSATRRPSWSTSGSVRTSSAGSTTSSAAAGPRRRNVSRTTRRTARSDSGCASAIRDEAPNLLLAVGPNLEVLGPPEIRERGRDAGDARSRPLSRRRRRSTRAAESCRIVRGAGGVRPRSSRSASRSRRRR